MVREVQVRHQQGGWRIAGRAEITSAGNLQPRRSLKMVLDKPLPAVTTGTVWPFPGTGKGLNNSLKSLLALCFCSETTTPCVLSTRGCEQPCSTG